MATIWRTENFSQGLHTKPARAGGGENYAADIENLKIDKDGWLQLRDAFSDVSPDGEDITGVATTANHLFLLRADGKLYVRSVYILGGETEVPNIENFAGRISIISTFRDYVIITSEGNDQGYWVDLRNPADIQARTLGVEPPPDEAFAIEVENSHQYPVANNPRATPHVYLYKITYVRRVGGLEGDLFNNMESNASRAKRVVLNKELDGGINTGSHLLTLNLTHSTDEQVTGINIYRTTDIRVGALSILPEPTDELDINVYRHIAYVPKTSVDPYQDTGKDYTPDLFFGDGEEIQWEDCARYERINHRMPSSVKQFYYFNNRIFGAAGDRLVYSDVRGSLPAAWAFPPKNEIRRQRPGRVDFCTEYREALLFGSADGLFRLTGFDAFDINVDDISAVGPVDPYSWSILQDTFGFVAEDGLHVTDASTTQLISEFVLENFFEGEIVTQGAVLFIEKNTVLFGIKLLDGRTFLFLFEDGHWIRWTGKFIEQAVRLNRGFGTEILIANKERLLQRLNWGLENNDENLEWAWESNLIHGQEQGAGNITKRFAELLLSAAAGTDITLKTWVDTQGEPTERQFETRDDLYFQRIPIERIGKRLRFRLEGTGPVTIRGLQIEAEV